MPNTNSTASPFPGAISEVYLELYERVLRFVERRISPTLRSKISASGIAQSALWSFFCNNHDLKDFSNTDDFVRVIFAIARNKCASAARHLTATKRNATKDVPGIESVQPSDAPGPEFEVEVQEAYTTGVNGLTEREIELIDLSLLGHTVEEIERITGIGQRTIERTRARFGHALGYKFDATTRRFMKFNIH